MSSFEDIVQSRFSYKNFRLQITADVSKICKTVQADIAFILDGLSETVHVFA